MTARDTIAKTLLYAVGVEPDSDDVTALLDALPVADAVITAVRAMPVEDQVDLVGWPRPRDDFGPPPPPADDFKCCASGSCEVCRPSFGWIR
jgi:hypothetical protein